MAVFVPNHMLRSACALGLICLSLASPPSRDAWGQVQESPFQAYRVAHMPADVAANELRRLLAEMGTGADVLVDQQQNRLLLQGPPATHHLAAEILRCAGIIV